MIWTLGMGSAFTQYEQKRQIINNEDNSSAQSQFKKLNFKDWANEYKEDIWKKCNYTIMTIYFYGNINCKYKYKYNICFNYHGESIKLGIK